MVLCSLRSDTLPCSTPRRARLCPMPTYPGQRPLRHCAVHCSMPSSSRPCSVRIGARHRSRHCSTSQSTVRGHSLLSTQLCTSRQRSQPGSVAQCSRPGEPGLCSSPCCSVLRSRPNCAKPGSGNSDAMRGSKMLSMRNCAMPCSKRCYTRRRSKHNLATLYPAHCSAKQHSHPGNSALSSKMDSQERLL